ncbi:hypothetical protein [Novosphingobium sp. LASN5T]|uniref:hypothetical protein n=2 Tax=Novosphingobium TaxID=165696 RepID=UPI001CC1CCD7|nr:hypothetical protein [Novosphingobium sp. LASN5T]
MNSVVVAMMKSSFLGAGAAAAAGFTLVRTGADFAATGLMAAGLAVAVLTVTGLVALTTGAFATGVLIAGDFTGLAFTGLAAATGFGETEASGALVVFGAGLAFWTGAGAAGAGFSAFGAATSAAFAASLRGRPAFLLVGTGSVTTVVSATGASGAAVALSSTTTGASTGTETVSAEVVTVLSFTSSVMTEATPAMRKKAGACGADGFAAMHK